MSISAISGSTGLSQVQLLKDLQAQRGSPNQAVSNTGNATAASSPPPPPTLAPPSIAGTPASNTAPALNLTATQLVNNLQTFLTSLQSTTSSTGTASSTVAGTATTTAAVSAAATPAVAQTGSSIAPDLTSLLGSLSLDANRSFNLRAAGAGGLPPGGPPASPPPSGSSFAIGSSSNAGAAGTGDTTSTDLISTGASSQLLAQVTQSLQAYAASATQSVPQTSRTSLSI